MGSGLSMPHHSKKMGSGLSMPHHDKASQIRIGGWLHAKKH